MLRKTLRRLLPIQLRHEVIALREILKDGWRYQRATNEGARWSRRESHGEQHEARLTMDYHRIEKGLALPAPKQPFGAGVKERMLLLLRQRSNPESTGRYIQLSEEALAALDRWNASGEIDDTVTPVLEQDPAALDQRTADFFFNSRHSIRNFDLNKVPTLDELLHGVALARNTPSVCNRQAFRVHIFRERAHIDEILRIQNGATAFAHTIPALGVVTARRAMFVGPDERNQRWVDGGLFAMTLVWAWHAVGLSTCMLNWALPNSSSDKLRRLADIPHGDDIVVLIAIGHTSPRARVARSEKRSLDDLVILHS